MPPRAAIRVGSSIEGFPVPGCGSRLEHADLARVREDAARLDDRRHLAERLQLPLLARRPIVQDAGLDVDVQLVAGTNLLAQPLAALERDQVAAVDRVAEKNARIELG